MISNFGCTWIAPKIYNDNVTAGRISSRGFAADRLTWGFSFFSVVVTEGK